MRSAFFEMVRPTDLDASEIVPGLYQGSVPPGGSTLKEAGFSAVVLCAVEFQMGATHFQGIDVIHAPNDDDPTRPPTRRELEIAISAARQVALRLKGNKNVLVTCAMGLNRSGLVSALTLHMIHGWDGEECVQRVQAQRDNALCNPRFVEVLQRLPRRNVRGEVATISPGGLFVR